MSKKVIKKDLKEYNLSEPAQLTLFDLSKQNPEQYSNTIEMYDSMPKYYFGGAIRDVGDMTEALPVISRSFTYRNKEFKIDIFPATIVDKKTGKTISYYPSQREELVEDVLRKIVANKRKQGIYLDDDMAVRFTYYELEKELLKIGHGYSKSQIKQSIEILNKAAIEITAKDGNQVSQTSTLFPFVAKETKEMCGQERVIAMFHPLVTKSVDSGTYRAINYDRLMKLKMPLARWLHKHISHVFIQATENNPYKIKLSTIVANSGMKNYEKISNTIKQVKKALDELVKYNTAASYEVDIHKEKNKILDATFSLFMSEDFVVDAKKANKIANLRLVYDEDSSDSGADNIDFENLREEMQKNIFDLKPLYINLVIAKIRNKEMADVLLLALRAAEDYINKTPNCIPAAIAKSAIRDGWVPKNKKVKESEEPRETESDLFAIKEEEEKRRILQKNPIWLKIRKEIKSSFKEDWDKWLSTAEIFSLEEDFITLIVPNKLIRDWIIREFLGDLQEVVRKVVPKIQRVAIISSKV